MQCRNCQFHNMPGSAVCGRCGTSLRLGGDVDVHPPRARAGALAARRLTGYHTWPRHLRDACAVILARLRNQPDPRVGRRDLRGQFGSLLEAMRNHGDGLPDAVGAHEILLRAIVPGWPQWFVGQRWQAAMFFGGYVALLVPGLLDVVRGGEGFLLGLAFAVHAASCVDLVYQAWHNDPFLVRFARSLVTAIVLIAVVYGVPTWALATYASPSRIGYTAGRTFVAGDVLLINSRGAPAVGRVVVFQTGYVEVGQEGHRRWGYDGAVIDRVLAGPGDAIACKGGVLTLNGRLATQFPLNPTYRLPDFAETRVPANACFVLASNVPDRFRQMSDGRAGVTARDSVSGVVWFRVSPWARAGWVR